MEERTKNILLFEGTYLTIKVVELFLCILTICAFIAMNLILSIILFAATLIAYKELEIVLDKIRKKTGIII